MMARTTEMSPTMIPIVAAVCSLYDSTLATVVVVDEGKALVSVVLYTVLVNDVASLKGTRSALIGQ